MRGHPEWIVALARAAYCHCTPLPRGAVVSLTHTVACHQMSCCPTRPPPVAPMKGERRWKSSQEVLLIRIEVTCKWSYRPPQKCESSWPVQTLQLGSHLALCCCGSKGGFLSPAPLVDAAVAQVNAHAYAVAEQLRAHGLEPGIGEAAKSTVEDAKSSAHDDAYWEQPEDVCLERWWQEGGRLFVSHSLGLCAQQARGHARMRSPAMLLRTGLQSV